MDCFGSKMSKCRIICLTIQLFIRSVISDIYNSAAVFVESWITFFSKRHISRSHASSIIFDTSDELFSP